jgi:malonate-semialdehyde dehydrogenase (acetylating) / methylmalonate-semialdehyde dehydrogenase
VGGLDPIECHNFVGGNWLKGDGAVTAVHSPFHNGELGNFSIPTKAQIDRAVQAAAAAQGEWGRQPIKERSKFLFRLREILIRDQDKISRLKGLESGKTAAEAKAGLMKGIEVLDFALAIQNLDLGGRLEVSRGVSCEYRREPLGVIANITPFNFPVMVPMWTLPIAIVLGNAYIWKPSDKTPLTAFHLANAFKEAGLPDGILTVLHGGAQTVEGIIDHPLVKAIGFVGSTSVARQVYQRGTHLGKRVLALGGAKNHIVLLPDAVPELSGTGIADSFTGCAGQRCMAASVLLAVGDVDKHIEGIIKRAGSLKLGEEMGAIISRPALESLKAAIGRAEAAGVEILLDGRNVKAPKGFEGGNWLGATILDRVQPGSEAATVELFGPVLSIIRCKDLTEAIRIENTIEYGNACSVFTSSGSFAERVAREARSAMIGVNVGVPVPREPFSFGGMGTSKFGHGDITGRHSLDFWTHIKKVTTKWEAQSDSTWMS